MKSVTQVCIILTKSSTRAVSFKDKYQLNIAAKLNVSKYEKMYFENIFIAISIANKSLCLMK